MSNLLIEYIDSRKPNDIQITVFLQIIIYLRVCKCRIAAKLFPDIPVLISLHDRVQNLFPTIGTVDVAGSKQYTFTITELIEAEQRMKTGTPEMTIVC